MVLDGLNMKDSEPKDTLVSKEDKLVSKSAPLIILKK